MRKLILAVSLLTPLCGHAAEAQQMDPFLAAVEDAYPGYKMAWFYARTRSADMAEMELAAFRHEWKQIVKRFAPAPPPTFARDPQWNASLRKVSAILDRAAAEADAGRIRECYKILGGVRTELAALRKRNGVFVFNDRVDAYGAAVAELARFTRKKTDVTPADLDKLRRMSARMKKLVSEIKENAPANFGEDSGFLASVDGNMASIAKLDRGIERGNARLIVGAMQSIRADYVLLFVRYG